MGNENCDIFQKKLEGSIYGYSNDSGGYLSEQLITYIGNKRKLINFIRLKGIIFSQKRLGKKKMTIFDGFSGSGVVSRFLKGFSECLYVNDLEKYSEIISKCYLSNKSELDLKLIKETIDYLNFNKLRRDLKEGIISSLYCPVNEEDITKEDRVFYTKENGMIIDNIRRMIFDYKDDFLYLAPLLSEASVHTNTSGVFKGFHKNPETGKGQFGGGGCDALERIKQSIHIPYPVFSDYEVPVSVFRKDINELVVEMPEVDLVYYDPPYNQHPYGSNYFMLNIIVDYKLPESISKISGIPSGWNRSLYNKQGEAEVFMDNLIKDTKAKIILISYNNEGIIPIKIFINILKKYGKLDIEEETYNTYRGSRNLKNRSKNVIERLFILEK